MSERIFFLLLGGGIGFFFGYMVRSLSCIQKDQAEIKEVLKTRFKTNDDGLARHPVVLNTLLFLVVAMTVWAAIASQISSNKSDDAVERVNNSDFIACQNANETRTANQNLWDFVIGVSLASPGNQSSPRATQYLHKIQDWIDKVYQLHDCHDLERKYPIPDPPPIITFHQKHKHK